MRACVPWPTGDTDEYVLFTEGDDLYDAMVGAIGAARERVDLETYIYAADEVGWRIGEALAARARAGVRVRVLVDAAGSLFSFSDSLESYLRQHGHRGRLARPETRSFATIPASAGTRCIASTSGFSAVPGGAFL